LGGRGRQISEFEASLVCRLSSRTARATQRNAGKKKKKKKKEEEEEEEEEEVVVERQLG
jgi:ribosomal protein L12E/L44/L45/RPP1/RPP2